MIATENFLFVDVSAFEHKIDTPLFNTEERVNIDSNEHLKFNYSAEVTFK